MAPNLSVVLEGVLKADDTIELASHPALPPGPVRVRLEALHSFGKGDELLPDLPWPDESISAPCDLMEPDRGEPVSLGEVAELLPEPFEPTEFDFRP
jgi:hypothetical protein